MFGIFKKSNPDELIPEARKLVSAGKLREAMDIYNRLASTHPELGVCFADRGTLTAMSGNPKEAIPDLEKAIELGYRVSAVYTSLATAQMQTGDQVGAIANFGAASALDGRNATIYYNRASLHAAMGNRSEALSDLRICLTLGPDENFEKAINSKIASLGATQ